MFNVRPAAADATPTWANNLFDHIKALEAKVATLASNPPPTGRAERVPFDSKIAKRACKHCKDDPKSVDGGAAGQHWDSE